MRLSRTGDLQHRINALTAMAISPLGTQDSQCTFTPVETRCLGETISEIISKENFLKGKELAGSLIWFRISSGSRETW